MDTGCDPRRPGEGDLLLATADAAIAAQNAVTAAWSLGIGSCYIGDVMENCEKQLKPGDVLEFDICYANIVNLTISPDVEKVYKDGE